MRTNRFLAISLSLMVGVTLSTNSGCKKKDVASGTPPVTTKGAGATPPPAQATETAPSPTTVQPAPDPNTIAEGRAFPALEFASFRGDKVNLASLKGKVVLIDFWATWCGPCRKVMPDVVETYKEYHDQGFEVIGISLDKEQTPLEQYLREMGMTWPQYYDGLGWNNKMAKRFGVRAIPHVILIDKNGVVYFNTDYKQEKPPLHGAELKNEVAKLCSAAAR
jgi:thiol-disulfide isomerase/thioredoxin